MHKLGLIQDVLRQILSARQDVVFFSEYVCPCFCEAKTSLVPGIQQPRIFQVSRTHIFDQN